MRFFVGLRKLTDGSNLKNTRIMAPVLRKSVRRDEICDAEIRVLGTRGTRYCTHFHHHSSGLVVSFHITVPGTVPIHVPRASGKGNLTRILPVPYGYCNRGLRNVPMDSHDSRVTTHDVIYRLPVAGTRYLSILVLESSIKF